MVEADPNNSLIGQQIDRYRVVSFLGSGGMGEVYLAEDPSLGRKVALKLLPRHLTTDKLRLHRFKQEARSASALNHPNILTIHEIGEANSHHFIATEFIEGETLRARLARSKLETSAAVEIATQATSALAAAHAKGIVHRDIKPENIMVRDDGYVKVLDFGLAKLTERASANLEETTWFDTEPGVVVGTLQYMSPEQVRGQEVDARTDIWSMGAVLYEMVAGRAPYGGDTKSDLIVSILQRDPPPLSKYSANVPPELARIVDKCLEKDFEDRYQSAKELQVDLRRLVSSPSTSVVAPSRWRRLLAIAGGAAVLLAVGVGVWLTRGRPEPAPPSFITTPLTSFVGWEMGASLSPDASLVAYAHNRYGQMDLFVVSTDGGDPLRLTNTLADELAARWSPDGRYIAFTSDRGTGTDIYIVRRLGGDERRIAQTNIPWIGGGPGDAVSSLGSQPWSPDSKELVFTRMHASGEKALWKVDVQTGAQTQLTHPAAAELHNNASWSFDGKRIAFHRRANSQGSLWLMDASGQAAEQLLGDNYSAHAPAWLPDNERLIFISNRGGKRDLWEIELQSRQLRQITSGGADNVLTPSVSANGRIAYPQYSHQVDIYWGEISQPHEQHQRLTAHTFNNFGARVSPDGQQVLYFSDRTGNYDLWLLDRRSGSERRLTDTPGADLMGDWSPDGKKIVFLSSRAGSPQMWVMNFDSGQTLRISERGHSIAGEPHFSGPRWSPDGKAIGFIASSGTEETLVITDVNGGNERSPLSRVDTFDWWRDSQHVIYTTKAADGLMEMRAADLETKKEVVLLRGPTAEMVVARDGSAVAYLHAVSHFAMQVVVQRLSVGPDGLPVLAGPHKQITNGGGEWHVHMGGWSPDAKAVVYTRDADSGDIYMIQNYR